VLRVGYRVHTVYALVFRRRARGVKCLLTQGGEIVLVRHTYGPRGTWYLPGGGVRRGETTAHAAEREMQEELGLTDVAFRDVGTVELFLDHRLVHLGCVAAELVDRELRPDPAEIAEARFFGAAALPGRVGGEVPTLVRLAFPNVDEEGGARMGQSDPHRLD